MAPLESGAFGRVNGRVNGNGNGGGGDEVSWPCTSFRTCWDHLHLLSVDSDLLVRRKPWILQGIKLQSHNYHTATYSFSLSLSLSLLLSNDTLN